MKWSRSVQTWGGACTSTRFCGLEWTNCTSCCSLTHTSSNTSSPSDTSQVSTLPPAVSTSSLHLPAYAVQTLSSEGEQRRSFSLMHLQNFTSILSLVQCDILISLQTLPSLSYSLSLSFVLSLSLPLVLYFSIPFSLSFSCAPSYSFSLWFFHSCTFFCSCHSRALVFCLCVSFSHLAHSHTLSHTLSITHTMSLFLTLSCSVSVSDLSVQDWQQDVSSGNSIRVLSYTIAINNPLGPKTAPVVETQVGQLNQHWFFTNKNVVWCFLVWRCFHPTLDFCVCRDFILKTRKNCFPWYGPAKYLHGGFNGILIWRHIVLCWSHVYLFFF